MRRKRSRRRSSRRRWMRRGRRRRKRRRGKRNIRAHFNYNTDKNFVRENRGDLVALVMM